MPYYCITDQRYIGTFFRTWVRLQTPGCATQSFRLRTPNLSCLQRQDKNGNEAYKKRLICTKKLQVGLESE